ncbi:MAG: glycosyltransferase [Paludibacteraceae bacterium]
MSKRLIILCDGFGPPTYGPRMTQLCKHLAKSGWDITLFTEQMQGESYVVPNCTFHSLSYYHGGKWRTKIQWALDKVFDCKERKFYRFVSKHVQANTFDIMLCSSFNDFPLETAARIAKEKNLPLVVDLRDIAEQWGTESYMVHHLGMGQIGKWITARYQQRMIKKRNNTLRRAKIVTTISPWHCHILKQYNPDTRLIYNGYDPDTFYKTTHAVPVFIISYTGRIYDLSFRNPTPLLQAVAELYHQQQIDKTLFQVVFHVESDLCQPLRDIAQRLGISEICRIDGYVPSNAAQELLRNSAISVVLLQQETAQGSHGIMTTKFFEALGCEKPVICTPSDNGCLADTIRETNAGIASGDVEEIKAFILEKYHEWQANGYTHQAVRNKELFSREYQAHQFENLFLQCLQ